LDEDIPVAHSVSSSRLRQTLAVAALTLAVTQTGVPALAQVAPRKAGPVAAPCAPEGGLSFLCGIRSPEDLTPIPGTDWIIASSFTTDGTGGLYAIDANHPALTRIYPAATAKAEPDPKAYPACATPPDPATFSALGLSIRPRADGGGWMYVVGGGARHGIEAFKIDVPKDGAPVVTWLGCVPAPKGANLNAVAGMFPGEMVTTAIFEEPMTFADVMAGKITGAVYQRLAGEPLAKLPNTALSGDNGVEVNREHRYVYVAATGTRQVLRYERLDPAKPPAVVELGFGPDNMHGGPGGLLIAGQASATLGKVVAFNPETLALTAVADIPLTARFPGLSVALSLGKTLWLGSHSGDRIAYRPLVP
jgi:hypothetical protein